MFSRSARLGLFSFALAGCNFSLDNDWVPPSTRDGAVDAALRGDAGAEAGAEAGQDMLRWCKIACAARDDQDECEDQVFCGDAAVCMDEPPCEVCTLCRDE
jgi:hypothetical protein